MDKRILQARYLLGVIDEPVTDSNKELVSWSTSKIGGIPDLINLDLPTPICRLCKQLLAFVLQIYAPLDDGSQYHRTLYLFGCLNRACWGRSESWTLFRGKKLEECRRNKDRDYDMRHGNEEISWLDSAHDWGPDDDGDEFESNTDFSPRSCSPRSGALGRPCPSYRDESDEFYSSGVIRHTVHQSSATTFKTTTESRNANNQNLNLVLDEQGNPRDIYSEDSAPIAESMWKLQLNEGGGNGAAEGAVGISRDMDATAEIESPDEGTIALDTPVMLSPESIAGIFNSCDLVQSPTTKPILKSWFLAVIDEPFISEREVLNEHERELLTHYQRQEGVNINQLYKLSNQVDSSGEGEIYEKMLPKHGDRGFHKMRKRIGACPEQLLRYSRDPAAQAILVNTSKVEDYDPGMCSYCHKSRTFEVQIMPAAIDYLRVDSSLDPVLEYGTVILYCCVDDCWKDGDSYKEEKVVVQADPDEAWFKSIGSYKETSP